MNRRIGWVAGLILLAAVTRLVPHLPNVTPISAMALFGSVYLGRRKLAYLIPLGAMLVSDMALALGVYGMSMFRLQAVVYACMMLTVAMGRLAAGGRSVRKVAAVSLASSGMFYLVTNFAVWAMGHGYPKTAAGLGACYIAGLPFFGNSVCGDLMFTAMLFGGAALLARRVEALRRNDVLAEG